MHQPHIICLQETWLNKSIEEVVIPGYSLISRLDRMDDRSGGGICMYAKSCFQNIVHDSHSVVAERSWHYLHTDLGPVSIANFYRSPGADDITIHSLVEELKVHAEKSVAILLVGDFNIHHRKWLKFSNANSNIGAVFQSIAQEFALLQHVHEPTRGKYLLDLVLSDLPAKVSVLPMIADHNAILATFDLHIPSSPAISRYGWCYKKADWGSLRYELEHADWSFIFTTPLDNAVCKLEQKILDSCLRHIPRRQFMDRKQEHPWLNDACRQAIRNKHIHAHDSDYSMYCSR